MSTPTPCQLGPSVEFVVPNTSIRGWNALDPLSAALFAPDVGVAGVPVAAGASAVCAEE